MAIFISDQNQVTFLYESGTYANPSGTSGNWIGLVTNHSVTETTNVLNLRYVGTTDRNVSQFVDGPLDYEGTLTYHPQDWRMLFLALGSNVDAGTPSPYTHSITEVNSADTNAFTSGAFNPFVSFTVQDVKRTTEDGQHVIRDYKGAIVNTMSISTSEGTPVECEVTYIAQSVNFGSQVSDIYNIRDEDTTRPYLWSDTKLHIPSGNVITETKDVNFSINNNLESKHYVNGSRNVELSVPIGRDYEVSATLDATSEHGKILYDQYWQGGSRFNAVLEFTQTTGSEEALIFMSGCKMTDFSQPSPAEGVDEFTLTFVPQTVNINVNDLKEKYNAW